MSTPDISVIVPVFNGARHVGQTLSALLAQTHPSFEVIVIDDGSTDESLQVVRQFTDVRIRLLRQENAGLAHSLNRGLREARAPIVARNDQDDISVPARLERQLQVLKERPDAVATFSHWTKFGERRAWRNLDKQPLSCPAVRTSDPIADGCLLASTLCARTDVMRAIGGFRQDYYPADDWDCQFRLSERGPVLVVQQPLVAYRFHPGANTYSLFVLDQHKGRWTVDSHQRRIAGLREQTFAEFLEQQRITGPAALVRRVADLSRLHMRLAGQRYLDGRTMAAMGHAIAAGCLDPRSVGSRGLRLARHAASWGETRLLLVTHGAKVLAGGPDDSAHIGTTGGHR
jgi:hypothetical protein